MSEPAPQLEYAPRPPGVVREKLRRWGLTAGIASLVISTYLAAPRIIRDVQVLRYQRQCLTYVAPPTRVVLETDAADAKKLLGDPRYAADARGTKAYLIPPEWTAYHAALGTGFQTSGTVFLHERTTPQGVRCLVGVDVNLFPLSQSSGGPPTDVASLGARIIRPGTAFRRPRSGRSVTRGDGSQIRFHPTAERLTIFAGQPDPTDPSHFTIDYELAGVRHTVDGWLTDDENVKLELRD